MSIIEKLVASIKSNFVKFNEKADKRVVSAGECQPTSNCSKSERLATRNEVKFSIMRQVMTTFLNYTR